MTNRQAKALARRVPFDPTGRAIEAWSAEYPGLLAGLERVVAKQLRHIAVRHIAGQTRAVLREQLGNA